MKAFDILMLIIGLIVITISFPIICLVWLGSKIFPTDWEEFECYDE